MTLICLSFDAIGTSSNREKIATNDMKYAAQGIRPEDTVTRILGCATMWHENSDEMREMLKLIFRMDEDYSAR